jgi:hypothetical protein
MMEMWVIYDHPIDAPDLFIARKWIIGEGVHEPTSETRGSDDLEALRTMLPRGLVHLDRDPEDDPKILEVWL